MKLVVFALVWVVTFGRHHLWILPNLTEDVGFFQSFWPLYKHENKNRKPTNDDKNDDSTNNDQQIEDCQNCGMMAANDDKEGSEDDDEEEEDDEKNSELDESLTAKNSNGFEILDENECNVDDN